MPGRVDGRLAPPPRSPNCVTSVADADDPVHHIAPLAWSGSIDDALDRLEAIVAASPRTAVVTREGPYLHVTYTTKWFRFVDDVEFHVVPEEGVVHVRSASRVGYGDMGLNRRRVEAIRDAFVGA